MRIAYLLGSLNRGGTETLLLDVFRNAGKSNLDAIGLYRKSGVLEQDFKESGLQIAKVHSLNFIGYILQLRKQLLENNINIAHAQQPIDALYARLACLGTEIKVILTIHGYDFNESILGRWIIRFIIKHTNANIYVSDTQLNYYQKKYHLNHDKQRVVYNGISFDKLEVSETRRMNESIALDNNSGQILNDSKSLLAELQLTTTTLLLGAVGNFNEVRDQMVICRFLKLLNERKIDFHFVFVGKRTDNAPQIYDDCVRFCEQNNLSERVSFLGSRDDVPSILHQLDAFLYATDHDTFGIAVVEAMAVGIPVFVNDWDVMKEITGNGKYATLYKTKNENDLLREFMLFLQNKALYQAKANEASIFVRKQYSIEKHIEKLKKVYNK